MNKAEAADKRDDTKELKHLRSSNKALLDALTQLEESYKYLLARSVDPVPTAPAILETVSAAIKAAQE